MNEFCFLNYKIFAGIPYAPVCKPMQTYAPVRKGNWQLHKTYKCITYAQPEEQKRKFFYSDSLTHNAYSSA